jgi:cysteine desulfurase family protein (TIGR01976 family)
MPYPLAFIREQFPALGGRTAFWDNAAGAQVPQQVVARMVEAMVEMQVNKGGAYCESRRVTEAKERVRAQVAAFVNTSAQQVAFGPNATTLIELLAQAWGRVLQAGDEIILTSLDHHANRDPWRRLEARGVCVKTWEPRGPEWRLELGELEALLTARTRLVAMTAASNALGTLTPVAEVARLVHTHGARLMVDAVHYAPHALLDVPALGADMLVFSPYKVFGPHLGVLILSDELLGSLPAPGLAFMKEGDIITWEPGTQNHEAIHAFGGVFDYLAAVAHECGFAGDERTRYQQLFDAFARHERALAAALLDGLRELGAVCYGLSGVEGRTATVAFNLPGRSAPEVAEALAASDVAVASGHYYAYELMMKRLGLEAVGGAVRASALHYTSFEELGRILDALKRR